MFMGESWRRNLVTLSSTYVGLSRGKESVSMYTDDKAKLQEELKFRVSEKSEGVEHITASQAKTLREPEHANPGFFKSIGITTGLSKPSQAMEHTSVHHTPVAANHDNMETIRERQSSPARTSVPKPQHEKTR
jgi:hypothetical protein